MMVVDPQRFNLYGYARNNPLKWLDPNGEKLYLRGDNDWLRANVLYEMAGGQEQFDKYFEIKDGQVVLRDGADLSSANDGVQLLAQLVNSTDNYLYYAGTDGTQAASLFSDKDQKALARQFNDTVEGRRGVYGTLVGTKDRSGTPAPVNLANGDPVFAVIAYNTNTVQTQSKVDYQHTDLAEIVRTGCSAPECGNRGWHSFQCVHKAPNDRLWQEHHDLLQSQEP